MRYIHKHIDKLQFHISTQNLDDTTQEMKQQEAHMYVPHIP